MDGTRKGPHSLEADAHALACFTTVGDDLATPPTPAHASGLAVGALLATLGLLAPLRGDDVAVETRRGHGHGGGHGRRGGHRRRDGHWKVVRRRRRRRAGAGSG